MVAVETRSHPLFMTQCHTILFIHILFHFLGGSSSALDVFASIEKHEPRVLARTMRKRYEQSESYKRCQKSRDTLCVHNNCEIRMMMRGG